MKAEQEIALQLTLKAIERMSTPTSSDNFDSSASYNEIYSKQVVDFYNNIYKNLDRNSYQ